MWIQLIKCVEANHEKTFLDVVVIKQTVNFGRFTRAPVSVQNTFEVEAKIDGLQKVVANSPLQVIRSACI